MAWIEQTKKGSRKSGGPQYYLQDLRDETAVFLREKRRCPVRLWTPYGIVRSGLDAVSRREGKVGHDRVQSGGRVASIADQIAEWFRLSRVTIERLEIDDSIADGEFVILPSYVKYFGSARRSTLYPDSHPLTIARGRHAPLIRQQIECVSAPVADWVRYRLNRSLMSTVGARRVSMNETSCAQAAP